MEQKGNSGDSQNDRDENWMLNGAPAIPTTRAGQPVDASVSKLPPRRLVSGASAYS